MSVINIGNISLQSDGEQLIVHHKGTPFDPITLQGEAVTELIDFIGEISGAEFNQRRTFRVKVTDGSGLSCRATVGEKVYDVAVGNISLAGLYMRFRPGDEIELPLEAEVELQLTFQGHTENVKGVVKRKDGRGYGLFFPASMKGDQVEPPAGLTRMVMDLQRKWMACRTV